jgi:hypothetical protein
MRLRAAVLVLAVLSAASAAEPKLPPGVKLEEPPADPKAAKIVLVAGSNYFKPGEHDYVAACAVLADLLKQSPGVAPVLALDWPKKPETLAGAKAVVLLFDGGDKHGVLKGNHTAELQKLLDSGAGLVQLHQVADYPKDFADRARGWAGGAWEKGSGQRAHWVHEFTAFPDHPIFRGVSAFKIDDGWLYQNRFVPGKKGVTPLLRTVNPKGKAKEADDAAIVAWAYERPENRATKGGRSFTFTGAHLHGSFAEEGYRRFLVNGILWSAGLDVPAGGAPVKLEAAELPKYLTPPPAKK